MSRASLPNRKSSGCLELPELLRVSSCLSIKALCLQQIISDAPKARCGLQRRRRRSAGHIFFCAEMTRDASGGSFFCTNRCGMPPAAYFFLACQKKVCKKETLENEIALSRLKRHFVSVCHSPMARPVRNALRAAVGSGFPSARYTMRVALFAPVEYLTYGSRKAVLFTRAAMHIAHKRTSAQGTSETDAEYFDYNADLSNTHLHRVL